VVEGYVAGACSPGWNFVDLGEAVGSALERVGGDGSAIFSFVGVELIGDEDGAFVGR